MANHIDTGILGEEIANNYLKERGFVILHKNWRFANWEIDIIAKQNYVLHFIEVKTRRSNKFGNPEDSVNKRKLKNLIAAAEEFTFQYPGWKHISFDILSINLNKNIPPVFLFLEDVYL